MVDIAAPNLKDLYISSDSEDLNVLIKINACETLRCLKLTHVVVTDEWLENLLPNLPNLEIIDISCCSSLRTVRISSNRLKYLIVVSCDNLIEVDLDTPNLLGFSSDIRYGNDIVDPLPSFHLKASYLLEVNLKLIPNILDTHWYAKLTKSLSNFNHSKAIALYCDDYKELVIPEDMRYTLLPPLYGTKHLRIQIENRFDRPIVVGIVDCLLCFSPQLEFLSLGSTGDSKTLKFKYRDVAGDEDKRPCCASLPWKCWRHELKKVELQNFDLMELLNLENFFFTNTDKLEIIEEPQGWKLF